MIVAVIIVITIAVILIIYYKPSTKVATFVDGRILMPTSQPAEYIIDITRGFPVNATLINDPEGLPNQTLSTCQKRAMDKGYVAFGYRTSEYSDPRLRNTCYFYNELAQTNQYPSPNNPDYMGNISGCSKPGKFLHAKCL